MALRPSSHWRALLRAQQAGPLTGDVLLACLCWRPVALAHAHRVTGGRCGAQEAGPQRGRAPGGTRTRPPSHRRALRAQEAGPQRGRAPGGTRTRPPSHRRALRAQEAGPQRGRAPPHAELAAPASGSDNRPGRRLALRAHESRLHTHGRGNHRRRRAQSMHASATRAAALSIMST